MDTGQEEQSDVNVDKDVKTQIEETKKNIIYVESNALFNKFSFYHYLY